MSASLTQNLQQCVQRLQDSTSLLQVSVKNLENSTQNFSRLKKIIACQRLYELVTETEIRETQGSLAIQLEPRVKNLLLKAEEMLLELEQRENILQEETNMGEIELDSELKKAQLKQLNLPNQSNKENDSIKKYSRQQQNNENMKKLKEVKKKMERMSKTMEELHLQKQRIIAEQKPSAIKSQKSSKSRNEEILENFGEQIKEFIGKKKEIQQYSIMEVSESMTDEDSKWKQFQTQYDFFKRALQQISSISNLPSDIISDFETLCISYIEFLSNNKFEVQKTNVDRLKQRNENIKNLKKLCKLLYPTENLGGTIARIIEILLDSNQKEIFVKEFGNEFPPEQERRHKLQAAIATLNKLDITETVLEEHPNGCDNDGQMILKFKIDVDN
ncbi:10639_t:CDS:10 [Diversispora eburnea]|uniref:DASH complex subunit SPC19 n=2 Tax=Diversisporales TaxID=214509 RepID=A0A9N9BWY0_9GLOM|nr:10639_t:CDS:10 [Diversispora eburnea]